MKPSLFRIIICLICFSPIMQLHAQQVTVPVTFDVQGNLQISGMFGNSLSDNFTYKTTTMPHYGLNWYQDDWFSGGPTLLMSGYGGMKFFTQGTPRFFITNDGKVGVGTEHPAYLLDVLGTIRAQEVLVNVNGGADFVFQKGYLLPSLDHVATYVKQNQHLPDIPSADEMIKNGISLNQMQVKLLQKVEELTLYAIQQEKEIESLKAEVQNLKK